MINKLLLAAGTIIILLFSAFSCGISKNRLKLNDITLQTDNEITIWMHGLDSHMEYATEYAAKVIQQEVFGNSASCPSVAALRANDTITIREGINVYDSFDAPATTFNGCALPYISIANTGRYAIINFCKQRINAVDWAHALDPDVYLILHATSRALGLPTSYSSVTGVASYTANDIIVLTGENDDGFSPRSPLTPRLFFRFSEKEKKLLKEEYCSNAK